MVRPDFELFRLRLLGVHETKFHCLWDASVAGQPRADAAAVPGGATGLNLWFGKRTTFALSEPDDVIERSGQAAGIGDSLPNDVEGGAMRRRRRDHRQPHE